MKDKREADIGRKYNSMKNNLLADEFGKFLNGEVEETDYNRMRFQTLAKVIIGRLKTLKDK